MDDKTEFEQFSEIRAKQQSNQNISTTGYIAPYRPYSACPNCGYCPHCGRGGHYTIPYNPYPWTIYGGNTTGIANAPNTLGGISVAHNTGDLTSE